jgi:hypothetical protein
MKQADILEQIEAILVEVPTDQQINVALRYGGPDEIRRKLIAIREKLEGLKGQLVEKKAVAA